MNTRSLSVAVASAAFTAVLLGTVHTIWAADPAPTFAPGETLSAAKMNASFASLANRLDALEKAKSTVPAGTIVAFGGDTIPAGWLRCDGAILARAAEAPLFAAIGTAWGTPNPTSFNLPDLRGRFLRGVDSGLKRDTDASTRIPSSLGGNGGDAVGSVQLDGLASHTHAIKLYTLGTYFAGATAAGLNIFNDGGPGGFTTQPQADAKQETRPKNANVVYIIKQ